MADNVLDLVRDFASSAKSLEHLLGKGLNIPNNVTNSGARKIMNGTHQSHTLVLCHGELPYVATGFENRFGDESSSVITTEEDYEVIGKVDKFSHANNHHYYLILKNPRTKKVTVLERVSYKWKTEAYGYLYNNNMIDSFGVGSYIPAGTVLRRSIGFDKYGNKTNGTNINVTYMSLDNNMEDSIVISDVCARKLSASLIRKVTVVLNDNDIPLNIYGDDNIYKIFPDIGEEVKNGVLMAYRRENKDDAIYSQAISRLREIEMSDTKITIDGTVIDINIRCNNEENLQSGQYNQQMLYYYNDRIRMGNDILSIVGPHTVEDGSSMSYDINYLFTNSKKEVNRVQFIDTKDKSPFSNVIIEFTLLENRDVEVGDKLADRYGGKGVVSEIRPQNMMPKLPNGLYADMIKNSSTMYGRENPGQMFEIEINNISMHILDYIRDNNVRMDKAFEMILSFVEVVSELMKNKMEAYINSLDNNDKIYFLSSILSKTCINTSNLPITEVFTIDKLNELYRRFKFANLERAFVPIKNSNGEIRFVKTRRTLLIAPQYCIRLKQFAEEKFSAVSLSSTNIKNENTKSKASKMYNEPFSNTSIKFGQMETGDLMHMGGEVVVLNLMLHSLSPHGRRLVEELAVGDPYNVDVKLDRESKNRSAEILNTRLKTMGYRIVFNKKKKKRIMGVFQDAISFLDRSPNPKHMTEGIEFVDKDYDYEHWYKTLEEIKKIREEGGFTIHPIEFVEASEEDNSGDVKAEEKK